MSAAQSGGREPLCEHGFARAKCIRLKPDDAQELTAKLMAALQRHGYGGGLCHCELCADLPVPEELMS